MSAISFTINKEILGNKGRAGIIDTAHGSIETPAYIPVGTKATVKGVLPQGLQDIGTQAVLANTYHLYLEPGDEIVKKNNGLGTFMNWHGPTFTDSGGFQVFSLGAGFETSVSKFGREDEIERKGENDNQSGRKVNFYSEEFATSHGKLAIIDEEGVTFTSHINGSLHRFTAERSIEIQHNLGADIMFAFDECTSPTADYNYQREAMDRTHRWAKRSIMAHKGNIDAARNQRLYGVVQGGRHNDLRAESAKILATMDFDGFGIGGSFTKFDLSEALDSAIHHLPDEKPRHLLGMGEPEDILIGIEKGCDTFDCVLPSRAGRNGTVYTRFGKINIKNAKYKDDTTPLAEWSEHLTKTDATYTRSYLHHLHRADEMLGGTIATMINIEFFLKLTADARIAILEGRWEEFKKRTMGEFYTMRGI